VIKASEIESAILEMVEQFTAAWTVDHPCHRATRPIMTRVVFLFLLLYGIK
jgi:hypothetical protein